MSLIWMLIGSMATAFTLGMLAGVGLIVRKSRDKKDDKQT